MTQPTARPLSVTIIAILSIIVGILTIFGGVASFAFAALFPEASVFIVATGSIIIAIGIAYLVVSYGLLKGRGWAWSVTIILSYVSIVFSIIAIAGGNFASIPQLIISIIIVFFLYRAQSKAYFGKPPNAWV